MERPSDQEILDYEKTIREDPDAPFVSLVIPLSNLAPEYEYAVDVLKQKTLVF